MSEHDKQLESFFAKKEKGKKSKGKSKFTTSDAITKQVGSTQKEPDGRSKDQPSKKASGVTPAPSNTKEEEWIDFQEPEEKDYSGLRIQSLQIGKDKTAGPWQQLSTAPQGTAASQASEESKPVGAYRPPAYRAPGRRAPVSAGRKMPEIDSEIAFPSLSAAMASNDKNSKETNDGKSFETVKHGSRTLENLADRGPQLDLGNKFDALRRS
ncbi:hypothetical protein pdam_00001505 [Pocillopora damicornis]|uniref:Protein CDV3 homolog n=1 Tax=Pocillopora damicornis TaxID=46731 RepID=A0A3M6U5A6_POCDA|nr:hypothetical protein pdam_00001505 [Pocillopora damicornis]